MNSLNEDIFTEAKEAFIAGNYKVAEPILQQLLMQSTRNPEVFQMIATIYYDKGLFNKAIRTFKRALEIDPTYTDASVGLSIILNDLGRYDEGKKVFDDARKILDRSKGVNDPYVDEKIASKHEELADLYFQYSRYNEALEQLLKAQKLSNRRAEVSMRIAECFVKMGDVQKAIRCLQTVLKDYPHFNPARLKLGIVFYNNHQVAEATEQWEYILIRDPKHSEAKKYLRMAQTVGITSLSPNP